MRYCALALTSSWVPPQSPVRRTREIGRGAQTQTLPRGFSLSQRAERKAGELLAGMEMHGGDRRSESRLQGATLKDLNIDKTDSHRWQTMARVAADDVRRPKLK